MKILVVGGGGMIGGQAAEPGGLRAQPVFELAPVAAKLGLVGRSARNRLRVVAPECQSACF